MIIIFCLSNLFVPHTLTLVKQSKKKVLVYTDQEGMYKFFTELSLPNVEVFFRQDLNIGKDIGSAKRIIAKRNELLVWLLKKNPEKIYFFHNTFGGIENWLIKKLSVKANIFHIPVFNDLPFETNYNIESVIGILKNYYTHGVLTEPLWTGDNFIFKLPKSFFFKYNMKRLKPKVDEEYIQAIVTNKFGFTRNKIVLLTGTVVELNQVEEEEYITKINKLINALGKDQIIAKPHPRFPNRYGLEKELEVIPSYIPANVLFSIFNTFIGYSTSVLSEAADLGLNAISTIDFFDSLNTEKAKKNKKYLIKNSKTGDISFISGVNNIDSYK